MILNQIKINELNSDYDEMIKEILIKAIDGKVSENDIRNLINKKQEIEEIYLKAKKIRERIPISSKELSEDERNKIKNYYNTGDFTQNELADIFGTAQATVSRVLNVDKESIGRLVMDE